MVESIAPRQRIMVIDDNEDSAQSLGMLLEYIGFEVHIENDGTSALHALPKFRPAAVLIDLTMPEMSGFEVAKRLRQTEGFQQICLIAITGWGEAEDIRRSKEAGFDHHLVKPIKMKTLETLLLPPAANG